LLALENIWDAWINIDQLEFFSRQRCEITDNITEEAAIRSREVDWCF